MRDLVNLTKAKIVDVPPSLAMSLPTPAEQEAAEAAARSLLTLDAGAEDAVFDTLARYEDFFPGTLREELGTPRASFIKTAGEDFAQNAARAAEQAAANFFR